MGKGRDKQGREAKKKKKKPKGAAVQPAADLQFRHHAVVATPEPPAKTD